MSPYSGVKVVENVSHTEGIFSLWEVIEVIAGHTHSPPHLTGWSLMTGSKICLLTCRILSGEEKIHKRKKIVHLGQIQCLGDEHECIFFMCSKPLSDLEVSVVIR